MTWDAVAAAHVGHRAILRDPRTLECVDCSRKLLIPKDSGAPTPAPHRFVAPERPGVPMPPNFRERVWADLKHKRELKTKQVPADDV